MIIAGKLNKQSEEAEAAQNRSAETSLELINTTLKLASIPVAPSPKGKALHKTGKIEEAIEIWEKLVSKIEGFNESVASALRIAKTEQILSAEQGSLGELDFAMKPHICILKDPDQKDVESELRSMLLKRGGK